MAESIGSLSVDLRLLSTKFEQGVQGVNKRLDTLGNQASRINKVMGSLLAIGGTAAFSGLIKGSLDSANRLGDLSNRLGVTVEGLSRLEYAAKLTGVSSTTLATGMQRAQRRIAEAANGTGEAVKALGELGLSAEKLNQLRPEQQFEVLADALENVPRQSDKVRLAMKLLDSEGVALLQTMKGGSSAIRAMGEESDRTGNTVSTQLAESATAANAAMIKFGGTMTGITNTLISNLGPGLQEAADWFSSVLPNALNFSSRAFNGIRATIAYVSARIVELGRVVTFFAGQFSDDFAKADQVLLDIQNSLDGTADGFVEKINETASAQEKFNVSLGNSSIRFQDYLGSTESATAALSEQKRVTQELNAVEKQRQEIAQNFESIRESQLTANQAEMELHAQRIAQIEAYRQLDANNEVQANMAAEEEKARHEKALTDIKKKENDARINLAKSERAAALGVYGGMFSNLSTLMNSQSKKQFQIGKTAAIASAVINGYESVVSSYAAGSEIGGPALGAAFAATAAAATAVQIGNIKAQQFGGGGTVNAGTVGGGAPNTYSPAQPLIPDGPSGGSREVSIVFNGPVNGIDAEHIAETLKDYWERTDFINYQTS